ncbi:hypothetical protein SAMN05660706_13116 [Desulfoscipio geothermicus DSM 3669]|uniref:Uncharacterized protein n=2 Tax=Desulfoscipio geothermicus TaxID=39060 RepID=A0A1I6E9S9_9FIRM|nr:hypothetical protein SAMN05660706_13116 [Desulfoscipio geothermicus DSM 3669]
MCGLENWLKVRYLSVFYYRMRGWPAMTMVILLTCLFPVPSDAARAAPEDKPVQIEAELGWQGQGVPGRYVPAVVRLKNTTGRDISGVVEAVNYFKYSHPVPPGGTPSSGKTSFYPAAAFGERISLPAGGTKKVVLWFPMNSPGGRTDFVFRAGDRELARVSKGIPSNITYLRGPRPGGVGVLGQIPPVLEKVRVVMPDGVVRYMKAVQLTGELFPRRGEELNAFTTILVTGEGAARLSAEQRRALARWVKNGGTLVISGGLAVDEALAALPGGTINVNVGEIKQQSRWQAAAAWLGREAPEPVAAAVVSLSGAGEPWGPQDNPLGMRYPLGNGAVTVLGFDPALAPWRAGALGESLWQLFLATPETEKWGYDPNYSEYRLNRLVNMTNNLPAEAFPGWRPVGLFLLVFMAVAGPGVYWLLRRTRRPEYTWVAVPVLAVLFAAAVYLYMVQTGGNVLVNAVQVVDNRDGEEPSGYTAVGFFAPTRPDFTAVLEDPDRPVQVESRGGRPPELMGEDAEPPYTLIKGSDLTVRFSDVSQWNMRGIAFENENIPETVKGLKASVEVRGNKVLGKVVNKTGLHLDHVAFFLGSNYKVLGNLAPGEDATAELPVSVPQYNAKGSYGPEFPNGWQVFMYPDGPPAVKPGMPSPRPERRLNVAEQRRAGLMDNWMEEFRRGPVETGWPLTVLAWSESPVLDLGLKELYRPPHYLTMFALSPEIKLAAGPFTVPAGLVMPEVTDSQIRGMFGHNNLRGMEGGSVTFAFRPSLPERVKINQVTLRFDYYPMQGTPRRGMSPATKPGPVPDGVLEIYHPGRGTWQPLTGSGTFNLPGDYATTDGEVKVRVTGGYPEKGTGFFFLPPTVAYGGEKE